MRDLRGQCALVALQAHYGHPGLYIRNEGFPLGCARNGPVRHL
jgi:hypothetical protein